jgi:hypothetical protein
MFLSTRKYYYDNVKNSLESKLGGIVWNGQMMKGAVQ